MKIALYIEDGLEQIVLTPQTATEKALVGKLHDGTSVMAIHRGSFHPCQGGWVRQFQDVDSTIIVLKPSEHTEATHA